MKRTYQIDEQKAIQRLRSHLTNDPGNIQLILPLADIAERLRNGVDHMLFEAELQLLQLIMEDEVSWLTGARYRHHDGHTMARWGTARGSVIVHGEKVPLQRPRIRGGNGDVKLGSYEPFRREEEMQTGLVTGDAGPDDAWIRSRNTGARTSIRIEQIRD